VIAAILPIGLAAIARAILAVGLADAIITTVRVAASYLVASRTKAMRLAFIRGDAK